MSVFLVVNKSVAQVWRDVNTLAEFDNKYKRPEGELVEGKAVVGQLWDGKEARNTPEDKTVTKQHVVAEYNKRWSTLVNAGSSRTTLEEAKERRNELSSELNGLNALMIVAGADALDSHQKERHKILMGGSLLLYQLELASKAIVDRLEAGEDLDIEDDALWVKS